MFVYPLLHRCLPCAGVLAAAAALSSGTAEAQLGVSPSQNAAFLTELRDRDPKRSQADPDVLGDARAALETGRELSRPGVFSFSNASPRRLNADITGFPGQYQTGRSYLTPWYDGVFAPATSFDNGAGLRAGLAMEQTVEYNSGVKGGAGGLVLSTSLLFDGDYKLAEDHRLTVAGGLGFNWISGNDELDWNYFSNETGLALLPGTSVAYDARFGPVSFTIYDRVSLRPYFGVLQNDLGIAGTWQVLPGLAWTLNYTRSTTHDVAGGYPYVPFDADLGTVSSLLTYDLRPTVSIGMEGAVSRLDHDDDAAANDARLWSVGGFAVWKVKPGARLRLAVGYQHQEFESTTVFALFPPFFFLPLDASDLSEPYYSITFSQRLSDRISHELAAGYESNLDFGANFNSSHYANYGVTAKAWKGGTVTVSSFVESSNQSESVTTGQFTSFGLDLHAAQQITSRLDAGIGYSYAHFETSAAGFFGRTDLEFEQHLFGLKAGYALDARTRLSLAYQAFVFTRGGSTVADHHRIMLGLRVQF